MDTLGEHLPTGFQGPVRAWSSLIPAAPTLLQLPRDLAMLGHDVARGDAKVSACAVVEVQAVTESLGRIEGLLLDLGRRLVDGGLLLLEVDNVQSLRMLHIVLEGRPGGFDPFGSTEDPTQVLPLRRVLAATAAAGLLVNDVIRVPAMSPAPGGDFARDLFRSGLLPLDWIAGSPPMRFWIVARKQKALAGSVLIAGGDAAARERTAACVREFLPVDWEVVFGEGVRESTQWNRAIAAACGDVVWCLRGGTLPSPELFDNLSVQAAVGVAVPGLAGERQNPGDLAGTMLPRLDLMLAGPLPETIANTQIALEECAMRLDAQLPSAIVVDGVWNAPSVSIEAPERFLAETEALMQRWSPVNGDNLTGVVAVTGGETAKVVVQAAPWAGRAPRVTLCMIARDEERFLPECLQRAREAVDEIVLVDTGSTDRTVAIAESFGAKVLHSTWQDDFSAPRNLGLAAATGDWILVLDADEFLQDGSCERIRELVQNTKASGYHLHFSNVYGKGKTVGVMMVRLFRNLPGLAYQNIIHEQVTPSLQRLGSECGLVLLSAEVEVEHLGYSEEVMDRRGKHERNERLFKKQLALHPDDIYSHYKYGDFLRRVPGRNADARVLLDRCLELILQGPPTLPVELPYAGEVAALCVLEAARANDTPRARAVLDTALRRFIVTPNLHYMAASLALADGRSADAIVHYRRCLAYRGQVLVVPIQEGITSYVSLAGIAQAWLQCGEIGRARRLLEQTIRLERGYEVAHLALSKVWLVAGDTQRALQVLTAFLASHPDSPGACQQTTLILQRLGQKDEARRMGRHAIGLLEARSLEHEALAMTKILATI